jgi:uncharacterized radical SAM superfamily Fe-S cluster-containing enzyme
MIQHRGGVNGRNRAVNNGVQHSGQLHRPIHGIDRPAARPATAKTELEAYKISLRRHHPADKGLPWPCEAYCTRCDTRVPARFLYSGDEDKVYLEYDCPRCGSYRELHHDTIFVKDLSAYRQAAGRHQPDRTHSGTRIKPVLQALPRTVETLCPECACVILGRYYVHKGAVHIEKTCPEHGYYHDLVNSDVNLYLRATTKGFEDERGVFKPQVKGGRHCPTDCGMCNQHQSTAVLPQIDLTNRCNLKCPVCFANANAAGFVSEPTYEMIVEMMRTLRNHHPTPSTSIQFTGGEPTLHPDFVRVVRKATEMGFSHIQVATNGIKFGDYAFAKAVADAGLHTLYMQFDGVEDRFYEVTRGRKLMKEKLAAIENCRKTGMKICFVPTVIKGFNDDQVGEIFKFAVENIDVVSGIAYQPVSFTGRIDHDDRVRQRYTLGDLAHDIADASGADLEQDFFPLSLVTPLSRILSCIDGKPKIRSSCHSDCGFGTYFFVTADKRPISIPHLFDIHLLMNDLNELAKRIKRRHEKADFLERLMIAGVFIRRYRWRRIFAADITPWTFIRSILGLTNKRFGRGTGERKSYKTLMAAGMHFMDRYNFDVERAKRCVILYSTVDGCYPFCVINCGPEYRPYIEKMYAGLRADRPCAAERDEEPAAAPADVPERIRQAESART